jgi:hypothetical protein
LQKGFSSCRLAFSPQARLEGRQESRLKEAGGDTIVAVELHVIEGGGDAIPSGHGCGLAALDVSSGGENDVAVTHRFAHENDFDFK